MEIIWKDFDLKFKKVVVIVCKLLKRIIMFKKNAKKFLISTIFLLCIISCELNKSNLEGKRFGYFVGFRVFNVVYFDTNGKCESYGTSSKDFSYNGLNRKESGTWSIKDNKVIINLEDFSGEYEYTGGKLVSDQKTLSE